MAFLLISPERWDAHQVSKHHYARSLSMLGNRVLFLDPPEPNRHAIALEPVADCPGLVRVRAPKVVSGLRWLPGLLRRMLEQWWLWRLEKLSKCDIEAIWLFENSRFFDLRFAGSRLKIYHQVDLNQNFHPIEAALTADICFCTSAHIQKRLLPHNPRCYKLQHGFNSYRQTLPLAQNESARFDSGQKHAMYVGNLEMAYLDRELIADIAKTNHHVCFHLVGGYCRDGRLFQLLEGASNVVWWGKVDHGLIPSLLSKADILMVCYQAKHHIDQANPHKLMEYLASGKLVVATYTEEYAHVSHLFAMSGPGSNAGYPELFFHAINHIDLLNSVERQAARKDYANTHSYLNQINRVKDFIQKSGLSFPAPDYV
ncbi:glycosyltransferase [Synechococcus sp. FGCU-3]|nr:glycosyltransferase [Synechococcus sp. FGCU3]